MITKKKAGRPAGTTGKARSISDDELKIVLKVTEQSRNARRNVAMLILSHYLGLRAKEMASLKISDVYDGTEIVKTLRLVARYTKGLKHRDISLENKKVRKCLEDYIIYRKSCDRRDIWPTDPLFRSEQRGHFSPNAVSRLFIRLYSDAGIDHASSHSGRRSLITKLAYAGVDLNSIRQIAGHQDISTTQGYIDDNPQRMAEILKSI
jgi:integrase/recombinase XerD